MENILLAGATGYLGRRIVRELTVWGIPTAAIARNPEKLSDADPEIIRVLKAEVTQPETLVGICDGIDTVISTLGITHQQDGFSYMNVDYQANLNLLREAQQAEVRKFIYISVIDGDKLRHLAISTAKEMFMDELKASGLEYTVIRPNGFYSDMRQFLKMAQKGKIYLFGNGEYKLNPIHGADLAEVCVRAISQKTKEITVGGPDILTHNEIAEMAFSAWGKTPSITYLPDWTRRAIITGAKFFSTSKRYGALEFLLTMMGRDNMAPRHGSHRLQDFYKREINNIKTNN
ncbi:SDR family oxidoreductase [Rhodohalobacter sulfatireducens]|uniref:SDR family oxidoreductase n=1 Tax=Rhodohalobacter sulfatireducens TaxID=2911366 RepID=A0ABS9KGM7_9BACT|nr:SDR family oxidoreductase [Rhodohalobacter sulfatireducens]MCG2590005.1 SDR family oxidoreductase [Rhodohalobacter sulfatireducens]